MSTLVLLDSNSLLNRAYYAMGRRRVRPQGAHLPQGDVRGLQGDAQANARRPRRAVAAGQGYAFADGRSGVRNGRLRGGRSDRHARAQVRRRRAHRHRRPRQLAADRQPHKGRVHDQGHHRDRFDGRGKAQRGSRAHSFAGHRPQSADGRRVRQHPRRARGRRKDGKGLAGQLRHFERGVRPLGRGQGQAARKAGTEQRPCLSLVQTRDDRHRQSGRHRCTRGELQACVPGRAQKGTSRLQSR